MTTPRPAALSVLDAVLVEGYRPGMSLDGLRVECHASGRTIDARNVLRMPWACAPSEAALESLVTRDLWPWPTDGADAAKWGVGPVPKQGWGRCSHANVPLSVSGLAAVASLGREALLRAAALADVVEPGAMVVWKTLSRRRIAGLLLRNCRWMSHGDDGPMSLYGFGVGGIGQSLSDSVTAESPLSTERAEASWPALYELFTLGTHLIACGDGQVVLAVETL